MVITLWQTNSSLWKPWPKKNRWLVKFTYEKLCVFYSKMLVCQRVNLHFLWFSYSFHHNSHEISTQQGLRRCAEALHQSHPGFSWAPKKNACLVKKWGNHGENHGKTWDCFGENMGEPTKHGIVWGKTMGNTKKKPMGFFQTCRRFQKCFSLEPVGLQETGGFMPIERRIERHLWHWFGPLLSFSQGFIQTSCKCHMNFVLL